MRLRSQQKINAKNAQFDFQDHCEKGYKIYEKGRGPGFRSIKSLEVDALVENMVVDTCSQMLKR